MGKRWKRREDQKTSESRIRKIFPENHSAVPIMMFQSGIGLSYTDRVRFFGLKIKISVIIDISDFSKMIPDIIGNFQGRMG